MDALKQLWAQVWVYLVLIALCIVLIVLMIPRYPPCQMVTGTVAYSHQTNRTVLMTLEGFSRHGEKVHLFNDDEYTKNDKETQALLRAAKGQRVEICYQDFDRSDYTVVTIKKGRVLPTVVLGP